MTARKVIQICLLLTATAPASVVYPQDASTRNETLRPDPHNASIAGRVALPSGFSAESNVKITLSNSQNMLTRLYSDKHGEFKFTNLSAGTYYVQVSGDPTLYEPVTQEARLYRGQEMNLTVQLRKKDEPVNRSPGPGVVSVVELDQPVPAAARKEYERATKLIGKGQLESAIERLKQALAIYPDYLGARNDLGAQYLKLKRFDEAAEEFRTVVEKHPRYFNSRFNLGLVSIERKKYSDAISQFTQAIAIDSARPAAHFWLGIALFQTYNLSGAEREMAKALITGGRAYAAAHYYLAQVQLKKGARAEAVRALNAYLEEAPKGEHAEEAKLLLKQLESAR